MKEFWNKRYSAKEYVYGTEPNEFLRYQLDPLVPGKILFPADGEGRNSVFAAQLGWDVHACDTSSEGRKKAERLALERGVSINYEVGDFRELAYYAESFDAVAMIYTHFHTQVKKEIHKRIDSYLIPGGVLIVEVFNKEHLKYNAKDPSVGGPRDIELLYNLSELERDFSDYEIIMAEDSVIELNEGLYHVGQGSVCRFVARKPKEYNY